MRTPALGLVGAIKGVPPTSTGSSGHHRTHVFPSDVRGGEPEADEGTVVLVSLSLTVMWLTYCPVGRMYSLAILLYPYPRASNSQKGLTFSSHVTPR